MVDTCKKIASAGWFQAFITGVIVFAGVLVGIETYPGPVERHADLLHVLNRLVLAIFILEIVVKMVAGGRKWYRFFLDPWNVFDFLVVVVCLIPGLGQYAVVLRLARLLRVLKLITAIPKLQLLVGALLKSIPSMFYVSLLLFLLFYLYAVTAVFAFGGNDPIHFGNLQTSMLSLFRAVTLEDWTDLMYIQMYGCDNYGYGGNEQLCTSPTARPFMGALYFVSFVLIGTMIVLNLFIGVIMNGMDEAQKERDLEAKALADSTDGQTTIENDIEVVLAEMEDLQQRLRLLQIKASKRADLPT